MALRDFARRKNDPSALAGWWFATEPTIRLSLHAKSSSPTSPAGVATTCRTARAAIP